MGTKTVTFFRWAVLHRRMAHSALQYDSFCSSKRAILKCKMSHSASCMIVKKIQLLCSQRFKKLARFAYFGPSEIYFQIIDSQSTFSSFLYSFFSFGQPIFLVLFLSVSAEC